MRKVFLAIALLAACFACENKKERPAHILSEERMVNFLIDLHVAEARVNDMSIRRDSAKIVFEKVEDSLYKKHGIADDSIYEVSYEYYLNHIEALDKIYGAVVDSLSLRERLSETKDWLDKKMPLCAVDRSLSEQVGMGYGKDGT